MLILTYALLNRIRLSPSTRFFESAERVASIILNAQNSAPGNQPQGCQARRPYATSGTSVAVNLNHCGTLFYSLNYSRVTGQTGSNEFIQDKSRMR